MLAEFLSDKCVRHPHTHLFRLRYPGLGKHIPAAYNQNIATKERNASPF